jgi:hypothetical protein
MIDLTDLLDETLPAIPFVVVFTISNAILLAFTTLDHSYFFRHDGWFALFFVIELIGAFFTIILLEKWYWRVLIACFPISLIAYPMIISADYKEQLQVQENILIQNLVYFSQKLKMLKITPAPDSRLPKRPYVFMTAPLLDEMPDMLDISVCAGDSLSKTVGGTPFGISGIEGDVPFGQLNVNIRSNLLSKYPDFSADTKSIIIITQNWQPSGRLVDLDFGSVPELLHHVSVFVVEFPSGYLLWKKLYVGGSAHLPMIRAPGGGVSFLSYIHGSEAEVDLSEIPWDPVTVGIVHK